MNNTVSGSGAVSRRNVLRAGAVAGGAVWLAPVLTVVGADAARADVASGGAKAQQQQKEEQQPVARVETSASSLPRTGSDAVVAGVTGAALVAGGALAVRAGRKAAPSSRD